MEHLEHLTSEGLGAHLGAKASGGPSHYRVLDVGQTATRMEIREAYLRLKSTYGAGSAALYSLISEDEANEQMTQVEEAFRVLNDEVSRREYDRELSAGASRAASELGANFGVGGNADYLIETVDHSVVRTTRSTLPIIKLKANRAGSEEIKPKMQAVLDASDIGDGDLYRRLRELCDVSQDEMQERTKICISYLKAIEGNLFDRLPQSVYVKGFLRSYFRYLCVPDAERLVAAYAARLADWQTANRKA